MMRTILSIWTATLVCLSAAGCNNATVERSSDTAGETREETWELTDLADTGGAATTETQDTSDGDTAEAVCAETVSDFVPCGGELEGTWVSYAKCFDNLEAINPYIEFKDCYGVMRDYLDESTIRMTFSQSSLFWEQEGTLTFLFDLSTDCLRSVSESTSPEETCTALDEQIIPDNGTYGGCTFNEGVCACELVVSMDSHSEWSYERSDTAIDLDGFERLDYCVQGNVVTFRETIEAEELELYYFIVSERQ